MSQVFSLLTIDFRFKIQKFFYQRLQKSQNIQIYSFIMPNITLTAIIKVLRAIRAYGAYLNS